MVARVSKIILTSRVFMYKLACWHEYSNTTILSSCAMHYVWTLNCSIVQVAIWAEWLQIKESYVSITGAPQVIRIFDCTIMIDFSLSWNMWHLPITLMNKLNKILFAKCLYLIYSFFLTLFKTSMQPSFETNLRLTLSNEVYVYLAKIIKMSFGSGHMC